MLHGGVGQGYTSEDCWILVRDCSLVDYMSLWIVVAGLYVWIDHDQDCFVDLYCLLYKIVCLLDCRQPATL